MSLNYTAHFKYTYADDALLPGEEPTGNGICQVEIEREPETPEEWREVSRTIFSKANGQYKAVEIVKLYIPELHAQSSGEVIEGKVVDG